jgi:hypothetical protein
MYAGSMSVPELLEIPGLYVVPVNSFRPYDAMRPTTFVLDTDVLIEIERFSFEPSRLGKRARMIRSLLVNVVDRYAQGYEQRRQRGADRAPGRALIDAAPVPAKVTLFGTHACGGADEGSDLDFLVIEPSVMDGACIFT